MASNPAARLGLIGLLAGMLTLVVLGVATLGAETAGTAAEPPQSPKATATPSALPSGAPHDHTVVKRDAAARPSRARRLLRQTRRSAGRWESVAAARRDGFASIGDAVTGHEHFVQWSWAADDAVLDARRPESLVYRVDGDRRTLVSVMYILPPGATMADVPDLGDDRAVWHRHTNLCWDGRRVAGLVSQGRCVPGGTRRDTPPMLHVWLTAQRCGPFAGLGVHGRHCASG